MAEKSWLSIFINFKQLVGKSSLPTQSNYFKQMAENLQCLNWPIKQMAEQSSMPNQSIANLIGWKIFTAQLIQISTMAQIFFTANNSNNFQKIFGTPM